MTATFRLSASLSLLLVSLLSACSPNPAVLQDRVYGSRAVPAPAPAAAKPKVIAAPKVVSTPAAQPSKVITHAPVQTPAPLPAPVVVVEPTVTAPPVEQQQAEVITPKAYVSSSAVQALVRTADAEAAKGNLDKAADTLERALRMEGDNPDLWMKLAKINEQQGKHDQALGMVSKAQAYREQLN